MFYVVGSLPDLETQDWLLLLLLINKNKTQTTFIFLTFDAVKLFSP